MSARINRRSQVRRQSKAAWWISYLLLRRCRRELSEHKRIVGELAVPVPPQIEALGFCGGSELRAPCTAVEGRNRSIDVGQVHGVNQAGLRFCAASPVE